MGVFFVVKKSSTVEKRYLDSKFFNRPYAENLCSEILNTIQEMNLIQISTDGPDAKWQA